MCAVHNSSTSTPGDGADNRHVNAPADGSSAPFPGPEPISGPTPVGPPPPAAVPDPPTEPISSSLLAGSSEQCPTCGAALAADQRYCLECGHRRGDPRLPFMDAVVFMDAVKRPTEPPPPPPPPPARKQGLSANASLVAGIGTLVLAIGVGVLIGRGGENSSPTAATPPIIKVGSGPETASTAEPEAATSGAKKGKAGKAEVKKAKKKTETGSSGATKATESVFKPNPNVKLASPTVKPGGKCESGTAGCKGGTFTGEFFGE